MYQVATEAQVAAQVGIERAADKAERIEPHWVTEAAEDVKAYFESHPEVHCTIELVRRFCRPQPDGADARAWGAVTQRALRLNYIERVPGQYAPANSSNGSPKPVYRRGRACNPGRQPGIGQRAN